MYTRDGSGGFHGCSDSPKSRITSDLTDDDIRGAPSCDAVSEQRPSDVLGALPRRRPQRRSAKRAAPAATPSAANGTEASAPGPAEPRPRTKAARSTAKPAATKPPAKTAPAAKPAPAAKLTQAAKPTPTAPRATARRRPPRLRQPAQPAGVPPTPREPPPEESTGRHVLGTAAQAAAELAEIGLSVSARALRRVVDRLPRP
jgi:hypothetical protein